MISIAVSRWDLYLLYTTSACNITVLCIKVAIGPSSCVYIMISIIIQLIVVGFCKCNVSRQTYTYYDKTFIFSIYSVETYLPFWMLLDMTLLLTNLVLWGPDS